MTVTVLMAVRNGLPYVEQAVQSVLDQTFRDFEMVIVEDASTDGTRETLRALRDPRIRLLCNESRQGQTRSLNRGLAQTKGRYVARMDADDVCFPERLETQVRFLEDHPEIAVVASRWIGLSPSGKRLGIRGRVMSDDGSFLGGLLRGDCPLYHTTVMFRREAVERAGGYDEVFRIGQDYDLWGRMALLGFRAAVLGQPLMLYRFHPAQQSAAERSEHRTELREAHHRLLNRFCPDAASVAQVAALLRADDRFWKESGSKERVAEAVGKLEQILKEVETRLCLTPRECRTVERMARCRVGWGIRLAPKIVRFPSWLFYSMVGLFSPLFIPNFRQTISRVGERVRGEQMAASHER